MICPNCKFEYQDGTKVCPECGEVLIDEANISKEDSTEYIVAMKPVKVMTVMNTVEAGIILNLLRNNGIPCIKKDNFMGGYMNIYMGYSVYGAGIYVDEADYDKAMDILSVLSPEEDTGMAEPEEIPPYHHVPFYKKPYIVARVILGVMLASIILGAILAEWRFP
jgi:hypothetical protein